MCAGGFEQQLRRIALRGRDDDLAGRGRETMLDLFHEPDDRIIVAVAHGSRFRGLRGGEDGGGEGNRQGDGDGQ